MTSPIELVYRLLGLLAPINQRLSRFRFNAIPSHLLFLLVLGVVIFINVHMIAAVQRARSLPQPRSVRSVLLMPTPLRSYVMLQGRLLTDARIAFDEQSAAGNLVLTDYVWVPMIDRSAHQAILVRFDANATIDESGNDVGIEGTIVPIPPALKRHLEATNKGRGRTPIVQHYLLAAGRRPGSLTPPVVALAVAAALFLSFVWLTFNKNVVFMASDGVPVAGTIQQPPLESLIVSGRFTHNGTTHRFFTNVAGSITRAESGNSLLSTIIETSTTRFGIKSVEYSGMWLLSIQSGSITEMRAGHVFWGMKKLRAIRFRFVNGLTGKPEHAVVASAVVDPLAAAHYVNMA
jgi:hypothetical protein